MNELIEEFLRKLDHSYKYTTECERDLIEADLETIYTSGQKKGIELAQRWIPVSENEIPPDDVNDIFNLTHGYSQRVLVKEQGVIYFGFYSKYSASWIVHGRSGNIQVSYWRPIELS